MAQSTFVKTYDGEGNQRGNYIQTLPDGGFIVSGYSTVSGNQDALLVRLNSDGEVLWSKTYGGTGYDEFFCAKVMPDGSFVALGSSDSFDELSTSKNVYLIRVNNNGDVTWEKVLTNNKVRGPTSGVSHEVGYDLSIEEGGTIFWSGRTLSDEYHTNRIFGRVSHDGEQLLYIMDESNAGTRGSYGSNSFCHLRLRQGWLIGGSTYDQFSFGKYDMNLTLFDELGVEIWSKSYGVYEGDNNYKIISIDEGFIFSSSSQISGINTPRIYEVDLNGVPQTCYELSSDDKESMSAYDVRRVNNSNIITMRSYNQIDGGAYLVKTEGVDIIWAKEYGSGVYNTVCKMDTTEYGGFVMVGFTFNSSSGTEDLMIVKADSLGNAGCNTQDAEFTVQSIPNTYRDRTTYYSTGSAEAFIQSEETEFTLESQSDVVNFSLGNDTVVCPGAAVVIGTDVEADSYYWLPGGETIATIQVSDSGSYQLVIEKDGCTLSDEIKVNWRESQIVDLGTDTVLCFGDSLLIVSPIIGDSYYWEPTGANGSSVYAKDSGLYQLTIVQNGCEFTGEIEIAFDDSFEFNFGDDIIACTGDTVVLVSPILSVAYAWTPNGESDSLIEVVEPGIYGLSIDNGVCSFTDSVHVDFQDDLNVDLGEDLFLCKNDSLELISNDYGEGSVYSWHPNGEKEAAITVKEPGVYVVEVVKGGCFGSDTLEVFPADSLDFELGKDTVICFGDSLVLNGVVGAQNIWQPVGIESLNYVVKQTGSYSVEINLGGCTYSDHISVEVYSVERFSLGGDTTICVDDNLIIGTNKVYDNYSWLPNGESTSNIEVRELGDYVLTVYDMGCSFSDTIRVNTDSIPDMNLGPDSSFCGQVMIVLNIKVPGGGDYKWSDGTTNPTKAITLPDEYWAQISRNGCITSDTVEFFELEQPKLFMGQDVIMCFGDTVLLAPDVIYSKPEELSYLWNTGAAQQRIFVSDTGQYSLLVSNQLCLVEGSISVGFPNVTTISERYSICQGISEEVTVDLSCDICSHVLWSDGDNSFERSFEEPSSLGVEIFDFYGCSSVYHIVVESDVSGDCASDFYVPNAFTPDGDGFNDEFYPVTIAHFIAEYRLEIFNRWGELIFESHDLDKKWDGTFDGTMVQQGVYNWKITYRLKDTADNKLLFGTAVLLR